MLDLLAAIILTALFLLIVGALLAKAPLSASARLAVTAGALVWLAGLVALAAVGTFAPAATPGVPTVAYAFLAPLAAAAVAWRSWPAFRDTLLALPLPLLVGLHAGRILGVFFLILFAQGRLPAPFASVAGWGDIAIGLVALPLALWAARSARRPDGALVIWNLLGALDLFAAIVLGVLSAPDTNFQLFASGPGTTSMGSLPWVMIPTLLVPTYFLLHFVIAVRLKADRVIKRSRAIAPASAGSASAAHG